MGFPLPLTASGNNVGPKQGKLMAIVGLNSGAAVGTVIVYDSATQTGTIIGYAGGQNALAGGPIVAYFPDGVEFKTGISVTLTGCTQVVLIFS